MSKISENPYGDVLRDMARRMALNPPGPAHLHTELATTFLYASIGRYLARGGLVACVLPDAVLNGYQHKPFREGAPATSSSRVPLDVREIWRVEHGTFKNEAIVVFGSKKPSSALDLIPGGRVSREGLADGPFGVVRRGDRMVWSDVGAVQAHQAFFDAGEFRQGADLMPRTLLFHGLTASGTRWLVSKIDRQGGSKRYLVKDAKKNREFAIDAGAVSDAFIFDALMSNHLTPFHVVDPDKVVLPFLRSQPRWLAVSDQDLAADPQSADVIGRMIGAIAPDASAATLLQMVETDRKKLSTQKFAPGVYLVVYGAGGGVVCAATRPLSSLDPEKLVIDQTLYWHQVATADEALYLVGMFNSPAIEPLITAFQPQGQQGERHIHKLPVLVTPRYDPADPDHTAVVSATRALIAQWELEASKPENLLKLDPVGALASRRSFLRSKIAELSLFSAYASACEVVYASV